MPIVVLHDPERCCVMAAGVAPSRRCDRAFMCELHSVARCESIGRRYRPRPDTKVSWTMVGSLTHAVGVEVSRGMPPIRREKRTMSEQTRIDEQLDQLVAERTSGLAAANDALRKELAAERQRAE